MNLNQLFHHLSIQRKLIIAFVFLSIVPVCVIGFYEIYTRIHTLEQIAIEHIQYNVLHSQEETQAFLAHVEGDIHYLSHSTAFQELVSQLDEHDFDTQATQPKPQYKDFQGTRSQRHLVEEQFLRFARSKPIYYRFKLIDTYGDELLKVERRAGQPIMRPNYTHF